MIPSVNKQGTTEMNTISDLKQLVQHLGQLEKGVTATIVTHTAQKLNKKDVATKTVANPFGDVTKVAVYSVTLNADYQEAVNEARASEGKETDFKAGQAAWGVKLNDCIVEHNGELYLSYIENEKVGGNQYLHNGADIDYSLISPFVPAYKSGAAGQGLAEAVKYRRVKLSNIAGLTIEGSFRYVSV
jgi:hypothetical protein